MSIFHTWQGITKTIQTHIYIHTISEEQQSSKTAFAYLVLTLSFIVVMGRMGRHACSKVSEESPLS